VNITKQILDGLGADSLGRLSRDRGLVVRLENSDRRESLARSYNSDIESLVRDLTRPELVDTFRAIAFELDGKVMCLSNPAKYGLDELRAFAMPAFAGRRVPVPGSFSLVLDVQENVDEAEDEDGGESGENVQPSSEDRKEADEKEDEQNLETKGEDDGENSADGGDVNEDGEGSGEDSKVDRWSDDEVITGRELGDLTEAWSRPQSIARILRQLGQDVPQRLRRAEFDELIAELRSLNIEACLANDPATSVLAAGAESAEIATRLRLRTAGFDEEEADSAVRASATIRL
jgi:hypothetical protein